MLAERWKQKGYRFKDILAYTLLGQPGLNELFLLISLCSSCDEVPLFLALHRFPKRQVWLQAHPKAERNV